MNIHLDNVSLGSTSGPNSFASKLVKYAKRQGHTFNTDRPATSVLAFIETHRKFSDVPIFQRLDGIYFNKSSDYEKQNANIKRTYDMAAGVIFQSEFNKNLITKYFGKHPNSIVVHNGADTEKIQQISPLRNNVLDQFENVWSCASHWRPHKRLDENIRYFLEHSSERDCLVVAGKTEYTQGKVPRVFFVGDLPHEALIALYKRSKYLLQLAWLDHCPNVVVDARASGCRIICSSAGGTKEIAGPEAIVVQEHDWDMEPVHLYQPPTINFDKVVDNPYNSDYNMNKVAEKYINFMER